ncbi:hypothetical protein MTR67_003300 [Solanum verrucosum]|uniref:Tf2-1-like SH3-like domain-containing protein n=1 Tax=Solanum verrucosum TaxID=315347 RepID=A0AAF0PVB9_SOLVR|nr:hypothetical protein MTR67_003300 [Solanum verrucosum]
MGDPASVVPLESVDVKDSLSYEDVPVEILDHQVRRLRNKEVALVKVFWRSQSIEGATWEAKVAMKAKFSFSASRSCLDRFPISSPAESVMAPYKALYGHRCRSPIGWFEVGEAALIGPDSVHETIEKVQLIRDRQKRAQSRQKSYADVRRRDVEFKINDWVFLKVSPMKVVMRFGKKGKLSPRYVGSYRILKWVEGSVEILDHQARRLRNKEVASVKVLWRSQSVEGATWEEEAAMMAKYLNLFPSDSVSG